MPTDKKISELPVAANVNGSDISVLVSGGSDYQYNFTLLLQYLSANIQAGASISFGTVLPQNNTGKNGDVFINTSNGTFAQKLTGTWTIVYTLPATNAADGTLLYGAGLPGSGTGKDMDSYINTLTGIFYKKSAGTWSQVFSMATGPQGPQGVAGNNGTNGTNGNTILFGAVNPSNSSTGVNGDFYINTSTYLLFGPKASGNWGSGISLIGSSGPAGAGITAGGTAGQLLAKVDAADYNTHWIDAPTGGGTPLNVADNFTVNYHSLTGPQVLPSRSSYFFGDSITVGFNATPVSRRWSTRIAADIGTTEINKGISGTCISNIGIFIPNMINRTVEIPSYDSTLHDYIFFAYGINDAANSNTTAQFETDYNTVISDAISKGWPLSKIVIVSPSFQSAANNTACSPFVTSCQTVATAHGVKFINVYAYMQANGGLSLVSGDNVHPTNAGYLAIYNSIMASLNPITIGISKVNGLQLIAGAAGLTIGADFADISNLSGKTGLSIPFLDAVINSLTVGRGGGSIDTNTALGLLALAKNTTGHDNTAIGWQAAGSNTTGTRNVSVGSYSLFQNTDGNNNIAIGYQTLINNDPSNTVAIGNAACFAGGGNGGSVAIGANTLHFSISDGNTAIGYACLYKETSGGNNTAVGDQALSQLVTGSLNVAVGQYALLNTLGSKNTAVGSWSLINNIGNNNISVGYKAGYNSNDTLSDKLWISNSELNNLLYGDFNAGQLKIGANVTGTAVPTLNPHAQLELPASNMGFMPNRLTTTQRDAITISTADEGLMIYNLTTHKLNVYDGSAWKEVTSS